MPRASISRLFAGPQGVNVKKGMVVLLIAIALVLLVSPGIIGRLAERSVDDGFDQAARDSGEIIVSSTGFDRGWFTSAGQHRIELREGELYYMLLGAVDDFSDDPLPALLIDTRLDHGLIPVSSMNRDHGSLMPGLGSAISTLSVEFADGTVVPLPGALYSTVGLTGELQSRLELQADSARGRNAQLDWGSAEFLLRSDARSGSIGVQGTLQSLAVESATETVILGRFSVDLALTQSGHGYMVGPVEMTLSSFGVIGEDTSSSGGPFHLRSDSSVTDERLNARLELQIGSAPLPMGGTGSVQLVARLEDADAVALGRFKQSLDASRDPDFEELETIDLQGDLLRLLAGGMALHVDQLDITGPFGNFTSRFSAALTASPADRISWAGALLALDASAEVSLPVALVEMAA
ncbi:MAG: YdgA family protein, partial [Gammaproteobacteria bacterium]|nr:YdgA family protein [Gammaproteobacteria bacterium]